VDRPAELSGNAPVTPPPVAQATPQAEPASADVFGNDEI